ncbi:MAG: tRNA (adenosine(37)-N6)-threonylcarbamoyltransferase complex dimerization subunit type 1 TsaB [Maritimibacter sp.]
MPSDPLILAFDTSAAHCAAALLSGDDILACRFEEMARGQAERLFPLLEDVLAQGDVAWSALDGIGVGVGPGNFTGIRIGVSAARGLALGLDIPAVGISTLEAFAYGAVRPCLSVLEARRGMVFAQSFDVDGPRECRVYEAGETLPETARAPVLAAQDWAEVIARMAAKRVALGGEIAAPAPMYARAADAAPPRDPAPVILPGARPN